MMSGSPWISNGPTCLMRRKPACLNLPADDVAERPGRKKGLNRTARNFAGAVPGAGAGSCVISRDTLRHMTRHSPAYQATQSGISGDTLWHMTRHTRAYHATYSRISRDTLTHITRHTPAYHATHSRISRDTLSDVARQARRPVIWRGNCLASQRTLRHHPVTRLVIPRDLHPALFHEGAQQAVQRLHDVRVAVDLERAELLDAAHAVFLHVAGDDA
jgi:hypothetical protein